MSISIKRSLGEDKKPMRRDFGHINRNQAPIGGYPQSGPNLPGNHYVFEGNIPRPGTRPNPARFLLEQTGDVPEFDNVIELSPDLYLGEQLGNMELPIHAYREEIKDSIKQNPVTIIVSETGSGKSTQLPQLALEGGAERVYLTQPRRIATHNISERIQQELDTVLDPERAAGMVGYQTQERSTVTTDSKIVVLTDGIEAVRAFNKEKIGENEVHIVDEVHEWNVNMELTLALIKRRLREDPNARFVLMSATIDAHRLAGYFADVLEKTPPVIEVPGRTYGIERFERSDSTVAHEVVRAVEEYPDEDILVFVAGKKEISDTIDKIYTLLPQKARKDTTLLPLHAKLSTEEQDRINQTTRGRKITVSTNVAQTSLTIPGVGVVVDSGEERQIELDEEGVEGLRKHPVSQADCDQRAGRTGRLAPGVYILTRYDENSEFTPYIKRQKYPVPEILRSDIDRTTLRTAGAGIHLVDLDLFHPVDFDVIDRSEDALRALGALDVDGLITPLGLQMNAYPVRPSSGRMLVEAQKYSPLVQSYLSVIVSSLEVGGLPYFSHGVGREWRNLTQEESSDLLAQLDIFLEIQNPDTPDKVLTEFNLDVQNVKRARELHQKVVRIARAQEGELPPPTLDEREQLKECIYTGMLSYLYRHTSRGIYLRATENDYNTTPRELSDRSVVTGKPGLVVGSPYRVEFMKSGLPESKHIIEHVTAVDSSVLGRVAMNMCEWKTERFVWRGGRPVQQMRKTLFGIDLGLEERAANPSAELRQEVIRNSLENPGPAQKRLRRLKRQLEELQPLTKRAVPKFTQDDLLSWIDTAAPADVMDPHIIDVNLDIRMAEANFTIDSLISPEERQDIISNAPQHIIVEGTIINLTYVGGDPLVRNFAFSQVEHLTDELFLADGRPIRFHYNRNHFTLAELKDHIEQEDRKRGELYA